MQLYAIYVSSASKLARSIEDAMYPTATLLARCGVTGQPWSARGHGTRGTPPWADDCLPAPGWSCDSADLWQPALQHWVAYFARKLGSWPKFVMP